MKAKEEIPEARNHASQVLEDYQQVRFLKKNCMLLILYCNYVTANSADIFNLP
jgi:hypothetical protein